MAKTLQEELIVKISADVSELSKKIDQANNKVGGFAKSAKKLGGVMAGALAVDRIVDFGKQAVLMASDTEESINKVEVAFGDSAQAVKDFAETSLKAFGISKQEALDTSALFGDMATSMGLSRDEASDMATTLTGLAGDLASFKNIQVDVARTGLAGVFTGETESLKQLGIVMTEVNLEQFAFEQGITKSIKKMTQAEKVQLRYNFVMEKTKNAQGDFNRTSEGTANQLRIAQEGFKELSALIGQRMLPFVNNLLHSFNRLMGSTKGLLQEQKSQAQVFREQASESEYLFNTLQELNNRLNTAEKGTEDYNAIATAKKDLINEINTTYGEYLPNLLDEKSSLDQIEASAKAVNDQLLKRAMLVAFQEKIAKAVKAEIEAREGLANANRELANIEANRMQNSINLSKEEQEQNEKMADLFASANQSRIEEAQESQKEITATYEQLAKDFGTTLTDMKNEFGSFDKKIVDGSKTYGESVKLSREEIKKLAKEREKLANAPMPSFTIDRESEDDLIDYMKRVSNLFKQSREQIIEDGQIETGDILPELDMEIEDTGEAFEFLTEDGVSVFAQRAEKMKEISQVLSQSVGDLFSQMANSIVDNLNLADSGFQGFVKNLIPTITKLITMMLAQSQAQSIAGATSSGTATGPAAVVTTPAFIATALAGVISAFATIPKFALGGIVGGSSFQGDNILARVNSGEMILNKAQQGRLFAMINNPNMGASVGFGGRLRGEDIFFSQERSTNRLSRYR